MGLVRKLRVCTLVALVAMPGAGCTRHFFRTRADNEANQVLAEKDKFPAWKIDQYKGAYPDPRSRFADPTNPDRPPMPPDDPAARMLAPNPQKPPHKGGIARVEGTGYLTLLAAWDAHNRQVVTADVRDAEVPVRTRIDQRPEDRVELPQPRMIDGTPEQKPYLLKLDQAVELGLINSREFQNRREDLYLAALPVTLERFAFAAQFFAAEQAILEHTGSETAAGRGDRMRFNGTAGFGKLFSTGALLLFQFANRTVVNLSGPKANTTTSLSTLNLDIVQPLLRGGGRAVTLEPLTQAERNLLYEIRDFARFRKEFFQFLTGGSDVTGALISPGGFGRASLVPGAISPGTGIDARLQVTPSGAARLLLDTGSAASSEGFMPTILKQAQVSVERRNLARLDSVLKLFQAYESGGRVSSLQVGQTQLQILQAQSNFLGTQRDSRDSLDRFKLQLGLPIDTPLELDDEFVRPILQQFDRYEAVFSEFNALLEQVDAMDSPDKFQELRGQVLKILLESTFVQATQAFKAEFPDRWQRWQRPGLDDKSLSARLTEMRRERLRLLDEKDAREEKDQTLSPADTDKLKRIERDLPLGDLEQFLRRHESRPWLAQPSERGKQEEYLASFRDVRNAFSDVLSEASNERLANLRPRWPKPLPTIINGIDVVEGDLNSSLDTALRTALELRLDLMNFRGSVVDAWRAIAIHANALQGVFNVGYHMDSSTPLNQAQPLAFSGTRTRHQLLLNLELPLVRLPERNAYRASLIAYQRARRTLMAAEDVIANQVRSEVRNLQVLAKNLKIQQQAVELAFLQVESALETFKAPPQPGQGGDSAASAAALTQQLLGAYARLPSEQTKLLNIWISYQVARQQLYLDLELMPLDFRGVWIDEFALHNADTPGARLAFEP